MLTVLVGQIDDFQDGTAQNWHSGASTVPANITGGPGGVSDRFIQVSSGSFGGGPRLVAFNNTQWVGNFVAAGVTAVSMDLKNLNTTSESIRIALRAVTGASLTGYASTDKFVLPADDAWHHVVFPLDASGLTAVGSPAALSTFLTAVADFRIVEADAAPAVIGDFGSFSVGVDNITAIGEAKFSFVQPAIANAEGNSGLTQFIYQVSLSGVNGGSVEFTTSDGTATLADNDYVAASGTLNYSPGTTSQFITVSVNGDGNLEADELFHLTLSNPTNGRWALRWRREQS